jgi:diacylglycerol kinase (ATP)
MLSAVKIAAIFKPGVPESRIAPFRQTVDAQWHSELTRELDAALIFGGDGTVHRYLNQLHEWQIPFLHVPVGSGNDFASSLGIKSPKTALAAWKRFLHSRDNLSSIDVGVVHGTSSARHLFCNVCYFGIDSDVSRRANLLSPFWRANGGYILSIFPALLHYRAPMVNITIDGRMAERSLLLAVAANGTRYGRGLHIAPKADMQDGLFDLCFVRDTSKLKVALLFPLVYFGRHLRLREVEYTKFKSMCIESAEPLDIYADGELICRTPAEISVIDAGLRVITPPV